MPKIKFGTDGWRAVMADEFTFANVRSVAWALASWISKNAPGSPVFVGYDRRFASKEFAEEAAAVLAGNGCETRLAAGVLPTPAYSFLAKQHRCYALVVTASHNPPLHNGIKIKTPDGASAPAKLTGEIELLAAQAPEAPAKARCLADPSLIKEYQTQLWKFAAPVRKKLRGKKIVVDYLHGSGAGYLEEALGKSTVIALRSQRDPEFGGIAPEPVEKNLSNLKLQVKKSRALLGVALDGDGDRISLIDENGVYLAPTTVFPMYAYYLALMRKEKGALVQGVSLGYLGERVASAAGLPFSWVPVGFKNIAEKMVAGGVLFGGEESGGYALGNLLPDRDGSINALLMLQLLLDLNLKPSALVKKIFKELGPSHYERADIHLQRPIASEEFRQACSKELLPMLEARQYRVERQLLIDGLKVFFTNGSWLLLRPSGTEPLVRVYVEAPAKKTTKELLDLAAGWAREKLNQTPKEAVLQ